jgi:hypothetical protein
MSPSDGFARGQARRGAAPRNTRTPARARPAPNALRQPQQRWQRQVRYVWDKKR